MGDFPHRLIFRIIALQFFLGEEKQCLFLIGSRRKSTNVRSGPRSLALPGNVCAEIFTISASTMRSRGTITVQPPTSEGDGASAFAADPEGSFHEQTVFWAPEALPTVVPVGQALPPSLGTSVTLDLNALSDGEIRQAPDGWHALLRMRGVEHRLWLKEPPLTTSTYVVELPLDDDFEMRAHAARRLWRALNGKSPGPPFHTLSSQRRQRLALALRALDARMGGNNYRVIAEVLFGIERIPEHAWKTHDLRNRTIRLVQSGFALMRGGYRELLRHPRCKK
jgi:hypothetical protein